MGQWGQGLSWENVVAVHGSPGQVSKSGKAGQARFVSCLGLRLRLASRCRFRPYRRQLRGVNADVVLPTVSGLGPGGIGASPLYLAMVLADESDEDEQAEVVVSTVSCTMPDGMTHYPDVASNTKDVATGVTFGNSKLTSPAIRAALVKLLTVDKRRVLSMSLGDLPGYSGPFPPCSRASQPSMPCAPRMSPTQPRATPTWCLYPTCGLIQVLAPALSISLRWIGMAGSRSRPAPS